MEMIYRYGGMNQREIGELMAIDYSTVSVARKKLSALQKKHRNLASRIEKIRSEYSQVKNKDVTPFLENGQSSSTLCVTALVPCERPICPSSTMYRMNQRPQSLQEVNNVSFPTFDFFPKVIIFTNVIYCLR